MVMTFLLVPTVVGMAEFATYLNNYLALTDAVGTGARALAISRGQTSNPCNVVGSAVTTTYQSAAIEGGAGTPALTFTVTLTPPAGSAAVQGPWQGPSYGSCASTSPTTGYAANLQQGGVATVNVKFTPTLIFNVFPSLQIQAQTTEIIQ
jgi:Flp pilus assembly protein TadG